MSKSTPIATTFTVEMEFEVEGTFTPGGLATPPSYSSGGDPPYDAEIEVERISRIGVVQWSKELNKHVTLWIDVKPRFSIILNTFLLNDVLWKHAEEAIEAAVSE